MKKEITPKNFQKTMGDIVSKIRGKKDYNLLALFCDGKNVAIITYGDIRNYPKIFTVAEQDSGFNKIFNYLQRNIITKDCGTWEVSHMISPNSNTAEDRSNPYFTKSDGSTP